MKKLLFLFFAFGMMQISAQDLSSMSKSDASSSNSMVEGLAADQVKSLTKKLNLNEAQQEQVSSLVVSLLKSKKFKKIISNSGTDKLSSSKDSSNQTDKIQLALLSDESFQNEMIPILDEIQMINMKKIIPR